MADEKTSYASHEQHEEPALGPALEEDRVLSKSVLWDAQRAFYDEIGIDAWRGPVPHYITSNPRIAQAYADTILGYARDAQATLRGLPLDIIELGAGSGRFSHYFLRAFTEALDASSLRGLPFRYVVTDFTARNVDFCAAHAALAPFVARGVLDFAVFDAERDHTITLRGSGAKLSPGAGTGPVAAIANYVFDGLPQDAFKVKSGKLYETRVSTYAPDPSRKDTDRGILDHLTIRFRDRLAEGVTYDDALLDEILGGYVRMHRAQLLFPHAALRCVRRLAALGGGPLLALIGDKGNDKDDITASDGGADGEGPYIARHGSISVSLNFHAFEELARILGGRMLRTSFRQADVVTAGLLLGAHPAGFPETSLAFRSAFEHQGPDDIYALRGALADDRGAADASSVLAIIRATGWDPRVVEKCLPLLARFAPDADDDTRNDLVIAVLRAYASYYSIGEDSDFPFDLGAFLYSVGEARHALAMFADSERALGATAETRWNAGLCHLALRETGDAGRCFAEASTIDPSFVPSHSLQSRRR
jgi:hypothetical protein